MYNAVIHNAVTMQSSMEPTIEIQPCNEIETQFNLIQQNLTKFKTNISVRFSFANRNAYYFFL